VEAAWKSCANTDSDRAMINKVMQCEKDLTWWNHNVFGNVRRELNKKRKQLLEEEDLAIRSGDNTRVRSLKVEINTLLDQETRMWKQRAWIQWLSKGDGNTKYFHTWASHRFRKNSLLGLYDSANVWTENIENIATIITDYYQELFTTYNLDQPHSCDYNKYEQPIK